MTARNQLGGAGIQTAALGFGGNSPGRNSKLQNNGMVLVGLRSDDLNTAKI